MRTLTYLFVTVLGTTPAFAQIHVEIGVPEPPRVIVRAPAPRVIVAPPPSVRYVAPSVRFEAPPPLVTVQPGVQVVEDSEQEVFFVDGYYWHAGADGTWWHTRDHRGGWVVAPRRAVPGALVRFPRGQYRHYRKRHEEKAERKFEKHHGR